MQANIINIDKFGGSEVMKYKSIELPQLKENEVLVKQKAIGFNYLDLSQRAGHMYKLDLPSGLGHEAAGVVEAVGSCVSGFKVGDRVAYMNAPIGAYADYRNLPAAKLVKIPDEISDIEAAALLFKGLTAQYLVTKTYKVGPGDIVLVHAAAGNVGQILTRWAKALGAYVIGTVSSQNKFQEILDAGCDIAIDQSREDWVDLVIKATSGKKVNVVYDSIGKDTFLKSMDCITQFGTLVTYGAISGPAPEIDPEILNKKGCLYLTRPSVFAHNATPELLQENADLLFKAIASGIVKLDKVMEFKFEDIVKVHQKIEERLLSGAIIFTT